MIRSLYRFVLCLHPPAFRKRFADEMLSIFDHAADKASAFKLLVDGLGALVRQWVLRPEFWHQPTPAQQPAGDGIPSFCTLDPFRPRAAAVIHGLVLSTAVFCMTCVAIKYSGIHVLHVRIPELQFDSPRSLQPHAVPPTRSMSQEPTAPPQNRDRAPNAVPVAPSRPLDLPEHEQGLPVAARNPVPRSSAAGSPQSQVNSGAQPAVEVTGQPKSRRSPTSTKTRALQSNSLLLLDRPRPPQAQAQQPKPQQASGETIAAVAEDVSVDAAERQRVIDGAIANLTKYYIDPDVAQKMADALLAHQKHGDDDAETDGAAFADLLTGQMRDVSHDRYLMVVYQRVKTLENPPAPTPEDVARYRKDMEQNNCTIEKVQILPHNVGYLKFNEFPDASICRTTVAAAMASLNHADAIIFDLRDNRGGYSNMVAFIATYLFDQPAHLNDFYNRGENSTEQSWTLPPVPGNRLPGKPVFVLTSLSTFSAAEAFSYDLKMLKRATLVGETTSGRGHMGMEHRIDDHFTIRVPGIRVVNPISKTNWEGTGVEPDVKVKAAEALRT